MEKKVLTSVDKTRLAELAREYVLDDPKFSISGNGGIIVRKGTGFFKFMPSRVEDFSTVVITVVDKLIENKKEIKYVQSLCSDAISSLVTTNRRDFIIKRLYTAHLIDEDPDFDKLENNEMELEIEIIKGKEKEPRKIFVGKKMSVSEQIAKILNQSDGYIVFDRV